MPGDEQARPLFDTVVVRLAGEIGVKSRPVRSRLERLVATQIRRALQRRGLSPGAVIRGPGRVYASIAYGETVSLVLSGIFGVSSYSPARSTTANLADITTTCINVMRPKLRVQSTFAVACRRTGKHEYSSAEVQAYVGRAILDNFQTLGLRVDLSEPDVTTGIEVVNEAAYVFTDIIAGAGGMPYGSQGRMVAILDGSTRAALAAWLVMRRGSPIVPLYTGWPTDTTKPPLSILRQVLALAAWSPHPHVKCYTLSASGGISPPSQVEQRRSRARALAFIHADALCEVEGAEGIIADDQHALGRADSDDDAWLGHYSCAHPVYMPLMAIDEDQIGRLAMRIGILEE